MQEFLLEYWAAMSQEYFMHFIVITWEPSSCRKTSPGLPVILHYVLASGVLDHSACYDPGSVLCADSSQLPHAAMAKAPFYHLLFCFGIWSDSYSSLGLAQWRNWCSYCTGLCTPCNCDVYDCSSCFPVLHFQSPRAVLSRTTKLPRIKPPNMAYPCSSDVILVASVNSNQERRFRECLSHLMAPHLDRISDLKIVIDFHKTVQLSIWQVNINEGEVWGEASLWLIQEELRSTSELTRIPPAEEKLGSRLQVTKIQVMMLHM
ncbi:progestin and adipoQ receptor family member 3 isoform X6 [Hylobates moloch]|uniref:progestin and adipoQ receptor family member 3 isoform X6 n=1 Tax=Hylobates moloch TaxID=81572 RepID=UPI002675DBA4|nr:progestin and adipoQ receptor family member 3 isoform X6 [Hylobates moloch]